MNECDDRSHAKEVITPFLAPGAEGGDGAGIRVADIGGEELDEAPSGVAAGRGDPGSSSRHQLLLCGYIPSDA